MQAAAGGDSVGPHHIDGGAVDAEHLGESLQKARLQAGRVEELGLRAQCGKARVEGSRAGQPQHKIGWAAASPGHRLEKLPCSCR